jgi:hypothetical protein
LVFKLKVNHAGLVTDPPDLESEFSGELGEKVKLRPWMARRVP